MHRNLVFAVALVAAVPTARAQTPVAIGSQFTVNSYTSYQLAPAVAVNGSGDFVVVWHSYGSGNGDTDRSSIQGRRFAAGGSAVGSQFLINSYTPDFQFDPTVAMDQLGDFVVIWQSYGSDNGDSDYGIQGQRFASDGSAVGSQLLVNSYTTSQQGSPAVAAIESGDFVVVWESSGSDDGDTSGRSIQGQVFDSDGLAVGFQFQVNSYTTGYQKSPAVAVYGSGDFVVVWQSFGADNGDTSFDSIQGQRFAADASAIGSQFLVNSYTTGPQLFPAVAGDGVGDFVVVWQSYGSDNGDISFHSIQGQRFAFDGSAAGSQFLVNSITLDSQTFPAVGMNGSGEFVVVWEDGPGANFGGRRFEMPDIFNDGFESGDVLAWSASVP